MRDLLEAGDELASARELRGREVPLARGAPLRGADAGVVRRGGRRWDEDGGVPLLVGELQVGGGVGHAVGDGVDGVDGGVGGGVGDAVAVDDGVMRVCGEEGLRLRVFKGVGG